MAPTKPWTIHIQDHPGSSKEDIANEPDWGVGHQHRIGFRNHDSRIPGTTSEQEHHEFLVNAQKAEKELKREKSAGELINFRDLIEHQPDFHIRFPEHRSRGWRYVIDATEDWVKTEQDWPANLKRMERERQKEQEEENKKDKRQKVDSQEEHEWRRNAVSDKHNDAYATQDVAKDSDQGSGSDDDDEATGTKSLEDKYSAQEIALLRTIQHESKYLSNLKENDGKGISPHVNDPTPLYIDEQDQFSPDNWLPRSSKLIRLTGKHPLNAEPNLNDLYEAGMITPNELHYVRNHGAVPKLLWEFHQLTVEYNGKAANFSMPHLQDFKNQINIPVALACDGNRRKELNMIKRSKGFNWGSGAISCAYWKGPLLRDVLLDAGVPEVLPNMEKKRYWVNFEGADEISEGPYATCIPFDYAMDPQNDVLLAQEMNNSPLPPDHGYPVRLLIPGYVGGRCVKWLKRIWISEKENDSHYHIWDNRVLPSFVIEKDGPFASTLFNHPDTACNEQNLNSIIMKPAQGETIALTDVRGANTYRIAGIAYDGGGHMVQRVEISLDDGKTWLYCIRRFPEAPIRHGNKFWTWVHWYVDVKVQYLLRASSITVRCFNVFKNTQPREPNWNIMGMMNNSWYVVKLEIVSSKDSDVPSVLFRHPTEPDVGEGGWMKPSVENQIAEVKQSSGVPQKEFTRKEIEKHNTKDDCWIVVDGKVYDATSVLDWHPGGAAAIVGHAGAVHQQTTDEFASIHDDYAYKKLNECALGVLTDKAAKYVKSSAEAAAKANAAAKQDEKVTLQKHKWVPVKLLGRKNLSEDARKYTFSLPDGHPILGIGTCQHILVGFHFKDRMLIRSYTPTKPLLPPTNKSKSKTNGRNGVTKKDVDESFFDGNGTFDLTVKTYFPDESQPGGGMSNMLDCISIGAEIEIRGPTGEIVYNGDGKFDIEDEKRTFKRISLVLGGSGITPGYAMIARIVMSSNDKTELRVIYANKTEDDILLREELDEFEANSNGQLQVTHVLSHPSDSWKGLKGHVTEDIIKDHLFPPDDDTVGLMCGPPVMIQKAVLPALRDWGYVEDKNVFGF